MTDPAPTPEPDDEMPEAVDWTVNLYGGGTGVLRNVPFGLGDGPTRVLIEVGLSPDGTRMTFGLTVGDGPDPSDDLGEALEGIAVMLEGFVEALRDAAPKMAEAHAAQYAQALADGEADDDGE